MRAGGAREIKQADAYCLPRLAVTFMMLMYALERRGPGFILAFACGCLLSSTYGFSRRTWPVGVVEAIWAAVAVARHRNLRRCERQHTDPPLCAHLRVSIEPAETAACVHEQLRSRPTASVGNQRMIRLVPVPRVVLQPLSRGRS